MNDSINIPHYGAIRLSSINYDVSNLCGLLLCEAMKSAEPPYQINGVNSDDSLIGENVGKNSKCHSVVRIIKGWDQNRGV
jgi:hypothetical protein